MILWSVNIRYSGEHYPSKYVLRTYILFWLLLVDARILGVYLTICTGAQHTHTHKKEIRTLGSQIIDHHRQWFNIDQTTEVDRCQITFCAFSDATKPMKEASGWLLYTNNNATCVKFSNY